MNTLLIFVLIFCISYPLSVIGIAFNVRPPFSLGAAGSAQLFLEGLILIVAALCVYNPWRVLVVSLIVGVLSYLVETVGVNTGFPFGPYFYTRMLIPRLPGGVPLPVMFAWILIVFGSYAIVKHCSFARRGMHVGAALSGALLATLLDLAIEPVSAHVVGYWIWQAHGPYLFYGVPLANFVAWFVVAFVLLSLMALALGEWSAIQVLRMGGGGDDDDVDMSQETGHVVYERKGRTVVQMKVGMMTHLAVLAPRLLFVASLFMFGLVDLTHGYYWATLSALLAGALIFLLSLSGT